MIYLITGVPGSGKSLYAVSKLIKDLMADIVKPDGSSLTRRLLVDGIPDLVIPHETMAPTVNPENGELQLVDLDGGTKGDRVKVVMPDGGQGVGNWFDWVKPGDVLLIDEVQRIWRPRGLGTKPPDMIKHLETHRHKGIDIVLISQNPMLIDQNVRRLVGRHIHVRRLFGMARAVLYDWDGCSVDVHRTKTATTSYWSYPKDGYKLYKSSELHTKQKQKIPAWLIVPVLAVAGGLFIAPKAFSTLFGAASGKGIVAKPSEPSSPGGTVTLAAAVGLPVVAPSISPASAPVSLDPSRPVPPSSLEVPVVLAGCARLRNVCRCYSHDAEVVEKSPEYCESKTAVSLVAMNASVLEHVPDLMPPAGPSPDLEMIAWASRRKR